MHLRYFSVVLLLCGVLLACQKDKDSIPEEPASPLPVEGYWEGQYTFSNSAGSTKAGILVRPGGTLRFYDLLESDTADLYPEFKLEGTWAVVDSTFLLTMVLPQFDNSIKAFLKINATSNKMIGPFQANGQTVGVFDFTK